MQESILLSGSVGENIRFAKPDATEAEISEHRALWRDALHRIWGFSDFRPLQREAMHRVRAFVERSRAFLEARNDEIGNVCLLRVDPGVFPGTDVDLFQLLCTHGIAILPGNSFGMPIEAGQAWFRMTLIHEPIDALVARLEQVDDILMARA